MANSQKTAPLKDFIKQTMGDIANALHEFQKENEDMGFSAFPALSGDSSQSGAMGLLKAKTEIAMPGTPAGEKPMATIMPIKFDIAVETSQRTEKQAGLTAATSVAIQVVSASIGGRFAFLKDNQSKEANKISFTVPLKLPLKP